MSLIILAGNGNSSGHVFDLNYKVNNTHIIELNVCYE
jgi:hypothetical protein